MLSSDLLSQEKSIKAQHIMEEFEKLLNSKTNEYQKKLNRLNKLNKTMLQISFTISRILFQFGNKSPKDLKASSSLTESLKFIGLKLEKCITFLQSEKMNNLEENLRLVSMDQNDSIIISKDDTEPPEWLRIKISKYKSQETVEEMT